jgi:post-segregation antitoxin (ccd killing protein)
MIVQIDVQPDTAALLAKAQSQGISVDALLQAALHWDDANTATPLTFEQWDAELEALSNDPALTSVPVLNDDAFHRETLYTRENDAL